MSKIQVKDKNILYEHPEKASKVHVLCLPDPIDITSSEVLEAFNSLKDKIPKDEVIVLNNILTIKRFEKDLRESGIDFFDNWENNPEYEALIERGFDEGNVYRMQKSGPYWKVYKGSYVE